MLPSSRQIAYSTTLVSSGATDATVIEADSLLAELTGENISGVSSVNINARQIDNDHTEASVNINAGQDADDLQKGEDQNPPAPDPPAA